MNLNQEFQENSMSAANDVQSQIGTGNTSSVRNPSFVSNSAGSGSGQQSQISDDEAGQSSQRTSRVNTSGGHLQESQPQRSSMTRNVGSGRSTGIIDPDGSRQGFQPGKIRGQRIQAHVNGSSRVPVPVDHGSDQYTRSSTRREDQSSHFQQQRERQGKMVCPIQVYQNQPTGSGQNSGNCSDPSHSSQNVIVDENHSEIRHEVQYRQQDQQAEKLSSVTFRRRQVYLIPRKRKRPSKNPNCNCNQCRGIETQSKLIFCQNEELDQGHNIPIWWKCFRYLLIVVLLLLCWLCIFGSYHLFLMLLDKYYAYKSRYSGFECGSGCG